MAAVRLALGGLQAKLVFCSHVTPKRAIALVARPSVLVFVQCCLVTFLVEHLSANSALEDIGGAVGTCCRACGS
jgi:hypothetical protein